MSLVGFKAKNHPQQATRDDVDDRRTPPDLFGAFHQRYRFTVDAAASDVNALLPRYWTKETDGLAQSWDGHRVWCNPPYSNIGPWVEKAARAMRSERCELVVLLLPANRTEQRWWQDHIEPHRDRELVGGIRLRSTFLSGRPRFGYPEGTPTPAKGWRPPFGCVLLTWDRVAARLHNHNHPQISSVSQVVNAVDVTAPHPGGSPNG